MNQHLSSSRPGRLIWLAIVAGASIWTTGCPNGKQLRQGIRITGLQPEASVFIDGHYVGKFAEIRGRIIGVAPGKHLVELRMPGFYNRYRVVRIDEGKIATMGVTLRRRLRWKELDEAKKPRTVRNHGPERNTSTTRPGP
jgi:hypothetical protein